jgi:hypothetical protein
VSNPIKYVDKKILVDIGEIEVLGTIIRYIPGKKAYAVKFDDISKKDYAILVKFIFSSQTAGFGELKDKFAIKAFILQIINDIRVYFIKKMYHWKRRRIEKSKERIHKKGKKNKFNQNKKAVVDKENKKAS